MRFRLPGWNVSRSARREESLIGRLSGISSQITLFVVVTVVVTALLVGTVVYTGLTRLMEKEATASLGQTTQLAATRLDTTLETLRQDTRILSSVPHLQALLRAQVEVSDDPARCEQIKLWQNRLMRLISEMLRNRPQYRQARFTGVDGQDIINVEQTDGQVNTFLPKDPCHLVASPIIVSEDIQEDQRSVHLSHAHVDEGIGASVIRAVTVVRDSTGLRGEMTLDLDLQRAFAEQRAANNLTPGLRFYVTDKEGNFLLHPEDEQLPATLPLLYPELAPTFGTSGSSQALFVRHADDSDAALHFRKVPVGDPAAQDFIGLAFAGSFKAVTAGSRTVARDTAVLITLLSVFAGIFAVLLVQIVVRPIQQLIEAAHSVAEGNGSVELPLSTRNEIGVLARAFQTMLDKLRQREMALANRAAQLDRINGELHELIYVMAHDLRAPLRAVSGLAAIIEEDLGPQLDAQSAQNMEALRARVRRMDEFIDALLEFSRAGLLVGPAEPVHIGVLLREVAAMLGFPENMELNLPEYPPRMLTDRVRLAQVFSNLIGNAVKHGGKPNGSVWIGVRDLPGDFYEFSVRDEGPGIAAEHHGKIFGMFQTLGAQSTGECAGVGLAIVKKIVESVGGRVWVESKLGRGAIFHFTWPKRMPEVEQCTLENKRGLVTPLS